MDDDDAARARRLRQAADIVDDALLAGMAGRAGVGEGAAVHDHVVLQILDDHRAALRIELHVAIGQIGPPALPGLAPPPPRLPLI